MRKYYLISIIFLSLTTQILPQGWIYQNPAPPGNTLYSVKFINADIGWAVGDAGQIMLTTNGGEYWFNPTSGNGGFLRSVYFIDNDNGWAVGLVGKILRTTDGGENWISQSSGTIDDLFSVYFINENIGWAAGGFGVEPNGYGTLLKTTDGGINWTILTNSLSTTLTSLYFTNKDTGWVVGADFNHYQGRILHTIDGGATWTIQHNHINSLSSIYFLNELNGWAVGAVGAILRTTDGGNNWINESGLTQSILWSVHFTDKDTGWCVGTDYNGTTYGSILKTNDGGINWVSQFSGLWLTSVHFVNPYTGWAVGEYGTILKTTNGGVTFIEEKIKEFPSSILLSQNYPNPFNPVTTINYQIPEVSFVTLKIYDVLGNEVDLLINEEQDAGFYKVDFNASKLSSGVYFYRLRAGDFVESKKMVLMK